MGSVGSSSARSREWVPGQCAAMDSCDHHTSSHEGRRAVAATRKRGPRQTVHPLTPWLQPREGGCSLLSANTGTSETCATPCIWLPARTRTCCICVLPKGQHGEHVHRHAPPPAMRTAMVPHAFRRSHEQEHLDTPNNVELTHTRSTSRRKKTYSRQPDDAARAQKTPRSSSAKKTGEKTETRANKRASTSASRCPPVTSPHSVPHPTHSIARQP